MAHKREHELLDYVIEHGGESYRALIARLLREFARAIDNDPDRTPEGQRRIREDFQRAEAIQTSRRPA